jgi:hypothetical protein
MQNNSVEIWTAIYNTTFKVPLHEHSNTIALKFNGPYEKVLRNKWWFYQM